MIVIYSGVLLPFSPSSLWLCLALNFFCSSCILSVLMVELEVIRHDSHPHELQLKSDDNFYGCKGCKELGFGLKFRCEQCNFDLHKDCALANQTTSHDFFKNSTYRFLSIGDILKTQTRRRNNIAMSLVITNLVLELVSAVLDQVSSSVNKTQFALFGMLISLVAMLTCILELIYEVRTKKLIWSWRDTLPFPWYYYRNQGHKPFDTCKDILLH
ncbi:hypothetical protein LWI29_011900 [Acer saccharum]|uniref:Phorbol-ester/DAG-type domain-containing protein n=1 Tax=Acer saccharum TaxID=4024 RepID=A0AA39VMW6_ACESA|nr:hypothetical protein LWI29_011900 [Acer saccharum]